MALIYEYILQMALLEIQQSERTDASFNRGCLFCPQMPKGNRAVLFTHMLEEHGFSVGLPDNLGEFGVNKNGKNGLLLLFCFPPTVFVGEFIDLLQHKLDRYD